ncbi:MAG: Hsp70 family protein [Tannerella sp.]|jgi:hypothetical protein|nr:Hsp70 family protein [Tannerella sp.]
MKRIGIDFGTTNSTVAYFDETRQQIIGHIFNGVGREYYPSAIAYPKNKGRILIGYEAQGSNRDNYYYYEFYKLNLYTYYKQILNAEHGKPVIDVVKDYLHLLIEKYKHENFTRGDERKARLEYIALAIPNAANEDQISYAKEIKSDLRAFLNNEAEASVFCAEAVCACEFYISKPENQNFQGNIVVVDYGGGTLNISNCYVAGDQTGKKNINVVAQGGTGTDERNIFGFAGVAFDRGVVRLIPEIASMNLPENELNEYAVSFEQEFKIKKHDAIREALENYYREGKDVTLTWKVSNKERYVFNVSLLYSVFENENMPLLKKHFDSVVPQGDRTNGGAASQDSFRVLPIGGFSQLLCVEKAIEKFLSIDLADLHDNRIAKINTHEKFISVAYGAAVYANKRNVESEPVISLFEIGVKYFDGQKMNNDVLVKKDMDIKSIHNVQWGNNYQIIDAEHANINIYCRASTSGETEKPFDISDVCTDNCIVRLCVTIQGNKYKLHVQNINNNNEREWDLSAMIADYKNRSRG